MNTPKTLAQTERPLLKIQNLTKVFSGGLFGGGETVALEDFSMTIEAVPPTITAIAGESGSGKTTLARLVLGFMGPTHGEIFFRGKNISDMDQRSWAAFRREVQAVFQDPYESYNPFYPVDHVFEIAIRRFRLARSSAEGHQAN